MVATRSTQKTHWKRREALPGVRLMLRRRRRQRRARPPLCQWLLASSARRGCGGGPCPDIQSKAGVFEKSLALGGLSRRQATKIISLCGDLTFHGHRWSEAQEGLW